MAVTMEIERQTRSRVWELAELMGESHADAIDAAVRERLEREKIRLRDQKGDEVADAAEIKAKSYVLQEIGRHVAARLGPGPSSVEIEEYLYDENGLPK